MQGVHSMKILCVIDHFGSGGAQRQLVNLALGLKARGHRVEFFIYHPDHAFFRAPVDQAGIPVHEVRKGRGFSWRVLRRLAGLLREESYDGVISFLDSPNVYADLAGMLNPRTRLIVSERASHHNDRNRAAALFRRLLHRRADVVVANSYSHAAWLARHPWLRGRTTTIYNGYPLRPPSRVAVDETSPLRLLVIGRVGPEKNALRLMEALRVLHERRGEVPHIAWAGNQDGRPAGLAYRRELERRLDLHPEVKEHWTWLGERSDIPELLGAHHALIHPSLHEGLPNVVCEALLAGRPVLASRVCDHPRLVEEGSRGFLFDPKDANSIADAIERMYEVSPEQWAALSANARRYAEENLGIDRLVSAYESLLTSDSASVPFDSARRR
jgi:glycosyltransferase involved in cell wall biosynthesis